MTPTARTLQQYRKEGWTIDVVERWVIFKGRKRRRDLYNFGDLVAFKAGRTAIVQATGDHGGNVSSRRTKIITDCRDIAADWLRYGREIHVVGWGKRKHTFKNGNKVDRWTMRRIELTYDEVAGGSTQD